MSIIFFLGNVAWPVWQVQAFHDSGRNLSLSFVRYADDDNKSPSACDWIIPGTYESFSD